MDKARVDMAAEFLSTSVGAAGMCHKHGVPPAAFGGWRRRPMEARRELGGACDPARAPAREGEPGRIVAAGQALVIAEAKKPLDAGGGRGGAS